MEDRDLPYVNFEVVMCCIFLSYRQSRSQQQGSQYEQTHSIARFGVIENKQNVVSALILNIFARDCPWTTFLRYCNGTHNKEGLQMTKCEEFLVIEGCRAVPVSKTLNFMKNQVHCTDIFQNIYVYPWHAWNMIFNDAYSLACSTMPSWIAMRKTLTSWVSFTTYLVLQITLK